MKRHACFATLVLAILVSLSFSASSLATAQTATETTQLPISSKVKPLPWPLTPATDEQIADARNCDADRLAANYDVSGNKNPEPAPKSACDWAALAAAYAKLGSRTELGVSAFRNAISQNSAMAFTAPLLRGYFGIKGLIDVPPFANQPVVRADISYKFTGMAGSVGYSIAIVGTDGDKATVTGTSSDRATIKTVNNTIDSALLQNLGLALTDFVPVRHQFSQIVCSDDYPEWTVTLTFKDGTTLKLVTNGSNIFYSGGPWQTEIDKQNYVQYSGAFLDALAAIGTTLELPATAPSDTYCGSATDLFPIALSTPEATPGK